ncbi:glycosyltransferase (plasmid) [Haloferacaceae archaeon DSL9]
MRVLQLVTSEVPFFTQQVASLENQGVSCDVLSISRSVADVDHSNKRSAATYARFYKRVLAKSRQSYDLVHANYGLIGPFAIAQPKRPVVLTLWGSEIMGHAGWLDRVSSWSARHSSAVIAPSTPIAENLSCESYLIPFGVDTSVFRPMSRSKARELIGWPADRRIVLFPYPPERTIKNYDLAEAVVSQCPYDDVELKTISAVPHEEVPLYMNASDAVLVTSRRESGPMVVKEAAACNVPVVSTDVGFVRDVLEGVDCSYVCRTEAELVDGLTSVLSSRQRSNGRSAVDDLSVERLGENLVDVYESLLGTKRQRRRA